MRFEHDNSRMSDKKFFGISKETYARDIKHIFFSDIRAFPQYIF